MVARAEILGKEVHGVAGEQFGCSRDVGVVKVQSGGGDPKVVSDVISVKALDFRGFE